MIDPGAEIIRLNVFQGEAKVLAQALVHVTRDPILSHDQNVMRNDIDELLQLSFTLSERLFGPLAFDPFSDQAGHGCQSIETIRHQSFSSEHSHHSDQPIASDEWIARKSDHSLTFCPSPVTDARIIQNVIR